MEDAPTSNEDDSAEPGEARSSAFPQTRWSLIVSLKDGDTQSAEQALAELCEMYWYPVYAYIRRTGRSPEDAEDLTQDFFANVIRRGNLSSVTEDSTVRFRSYVLTSVKNLLTSDLRKKGTQKRGHGLTILSIDAELAEERYQNEPASSLTPEDLFERRWALTVIESALAGLRNEYESTNRGRLFELLQPFIASKHDTGHYDEAARELELTEGAIHVAMHRLRKRYQRCIKDQIAQTVADPSEVEDELRHIFSLFAS